MAIFNSHPGSWLGLPDFGITEMLTSKRTAQGGSNIIGPSSAPVQNNYIPAPQVNYSPVQNPAPYSPSQPTVKNPTVRTNTPSQPSQPSYQAPVSGGGDNGGGNSGPSLMDQINSAYDAEQGYLSGLESQARSQADTARNTLQSEAPQLQSQLESEQRTRMTDLGQRENQAGMQFQEGKTRTKQLLSDLQNRNAAMLAYSGGYGSSLAPALAEKFGSRAFQSMDALNTSRQTSIDSINTERSKVNDFYSGKISDLKMQVQRGLADIETTLQNKLGQISGSKAESARAKASATMEAWQNYANQRAQLNLSAYEFQQQLDAWKTSKDQTLSAALSYGVGQTPGVNVNAGLFDPSQAYGASNNGIISSPSQSLSYNPIKVKKATGSLSDEEQRQLALTGLPSTAAYGLGLA